MTHLSLRGETIEDLQLCVICEMNKSRVSWVSPYKTRLTAMQSAIQPFLSNSCRMSTISIFFSMPAKFGYAGSSFREIPIKLSNLSLVSMFVGPPFFFLIRWYTNAVSSFFHGGTTSKSLGYSSSLRVLNYRR